MSPMRRLRSASSLALILVLSTCAPSAQPRETFDWAGGPVSFSPPGKGWRREGWNQGGWLGVSFVREYSVGERILVAEHHVLGARDRRPILEDLLERFDGYDERALRRAIQEARYRTDEPVSSLEMEVATEVNQSLDRALMALLAGEREAARREIGGATRAAKRLRLALRDVIDRVALRAEQRQEPWRWELRGRGEGEVGGDSAMFVDHLYRSPERRYASRDAYFMSDNHLFLASFHGLDRSLPVFDRVVASIQTTNSTRSSR